MNESDRSHQFDLLANKLCQLTLSRKKDDPECIQKILNDIHDIDYTEQVVLKPSKAILLIHQCCTLISTDDMQSVVLLCQLIQKLIQLQNVKLEGQTLILAVNWILQSTGSSNENIYNDLLSALQAILQSSGKRLLILLPEIVIRNGPLTHFLESKDHEVVLNTLKLLEFFIYPFTLNKKKEMDKRDFSEQFAVCAEIFESVLLNPQMDKFADLIFNQSLSCCLKGLQNIVQIHSRYLDSKLALYLGIVKSYMVYCLKKWKFITPHPLIAVDINSADTVSNALPMEKKGGKIAKHRKYKEPKKTKKNIIKPLLPATSIVNRYESASNLLNDTKLNVTHCMMSSLQDSQFDNYKYCSQVDRMQNKVRQEALALLYYIIRVSEKSKIFPYWLRFMPTSTTKMTNNLRQCILVDLSAKARWIALLVTFSFVKAAKLYLYKADTCDNELPCSSFAVMLGETLEELHETLVTSLESNKSCMILVESLKCLSELIQSVPYHRLRSGLLNKVITTVRKFIFHDEQLVKIAALIVLGCALAAEPIIPETKEAFECQSAIYGIEKAKVIKEYQKEFDEDFFYLKIFSTQSTNSYIVSSFDKDADVKTILEISKKKLKRVSLKRNVVWILQFCIESLISLMAPVSIKLEALQIIAAMTRHYFKPFMASNLDLITAVIIFSLKQSSDIKIHAARVIDFIGQKMNDYLDEVPRKFAIDTPLFFWNTLLTETVVEALQEEKHPKIIATGCDAFASVGPYVFEQLPRHRQVLVISVLTCFTRHDDCTIRAAAVRAVGICVQYPVLREDLGFVMDVCQIIMRTLDEKVNVVKTKASWALGNLSCTIAFYINFLQKNEIIGEEFPSSTIIQLLEVILTSVNHNDLVKMNIARALGNLLFCINSKTLEEPSAKTSIDKNFSLLTNNALSGASAKTRWNSCYALAKALQNKCLFYRGANWHILVFPCLCNVMMYDMNFKVKSNAAYALSIPKDRYYYANYFNFILLSVLKSLEVSESMEEIGEHVHKDHFVDLTCLTLSHLMSMFTLDDFVSLHDRIIYYLDLIRKHVSLASKRIVPEKTVKLFSASDALKTFKETNIEKLHHQADTLDSLINMFGSD